jgi:hypothetical protein
VLRSPPRRARRFIARSFRACFRTICRSRSCPACTSCCRGKVEVGENDVGAHSGQ